MTDDAEQMQVGALARAAGLTVRALHHYDAIGLLRPDERSQSGRRLYSPANVRRLYQILGLKRLGLSLEEIVAALDRDGDLTGAVRRHLARAEQGLELQRQLCGTLTRMLDLLERDGDPGIDQFIHAIEVMTMIEEHYTPEQLETLARRREELGSEGLRRSQDDWAQLIEEVRRAQADGAGPTDTQVRDLAVRWRGLIQQFAGGDEGIRRSLAAMYREQVPQRASHAMVDAELMAYIGPALAALGDPA